jgi:hypothetical protein
MENWPNVEEPATTLREPSELAAFRVDEPDGVDDLDRYQEYLVPAKVLNAYVIEASDEGV